MIKYLILPLILITGCSKPLINKVTNSDLQKLYSVDFRSGESIIYMKLDKDFAFDSLTVYVNDKKVGSLYKDENIMYALISTPKKISITTEANQEKEKFILNIPQSSKTLIRFITKNERTHYEVENVESEKLRSLQLFNIVDLRTSR